MKRPWICGLVSGMLLLGGCSGSGSGKNGETGSTGGVAEWKTFDPDHGKFSVELPGTPEVQPGGNAREKQWTVESGGVKYSIRYMDLRADGPANAEWAQRQIEVRLDTFLMESSAQRKVEIDKRIELGGQSGLEVVFDLPDKSRNRLWICVAGTRMYWLQVSGTKDLVNSVTISRFPNSFKIGR